MVLRRRLHRAAVHGISSRKESCEILFRLGAMRSAASLVVQFQISARPAVRCSLYDMPEDIGAGMLFHAVLDILRSRVVNK
jgi:hypothetical protein